MEEHRESLEELRAGLRKLRLTSFILCLGPTLFVLVLLGLRLMGVVPAGSIMPPLFLSSLAIFVVGLVLVLSRWVPSLVCGESFASSALRQWAAMQTNPAFDTSTPDGQLAFRYATASTVRSALLVFASCFAGAAHLLDGGWLAPAMQITPIAAMVIRFPTQPRLSEWLRARRDEQQTVL